MQLNYSPIANKIIVHTLSKDDEVTFCVEDFGMGNSEDNLGRVFDQILLSMGDMQAYFSRLGFRFVHFFRNNKKRKWQNLGKQ